MTAVLNDRSSKPGTHGFIIGVGGYRHLQGGTMPKDIDLGLGQLKSPLVSARAIADWLLDEHRNPDAPVRSLELLLSPSGVYKNPRNGRDIQITSATMANVKAAFTRWMRRCGKNTKNVAIFYFCGHGVKKARSSLLLEDFGADPYKLFENAIDFEGTHDGMMSQCPAKVQCFIADACRQVSYESLKRNTNGTALIETDETTCYAADGPRYYATAPIDLAYGEADGPTRFTQALLRSLRGLGSTAQRGSWVVLTGGLQAGILAAMQQLQRDSTNEAQRPMVGGQQSGETLLTVLKRPPEVPLTVSFDPPEAARQAQLCISSVTNPQNRWERSLQPGSWELEIPCDDYDGSATFPRRQYPDGSCRIRPVPPAPEILWTLR